MEVRNLPERSDTNQPGDFANAQRKRAEENKSGLLLLTKLILSDSMSSQNKSDRNEASKNGELSFSSG